MKNVELTCANCGNLFHKEFKEYKRQIKSGKNRFFCGLSCVCIKRNEENPPKGNLQNLIPGKTKDQYTPFRWYLLRIDCRSRKKNRDYDITLEYLKILWEEQKGICPLTGWELILPKDTRQAWNVANIRNASLDRIDSSKGYMQGNVRFVAVIANYAKQSFTDKELFEFCNSVTEYLKCPNKEMV